MGRDGCGDGTCEFWQGETATTCPQDCSQCGDGRCTGNETPTSCPADCAGCGDGVCSITESAMSCPADCGWGSGGGAGGGGGGGGGGGSTDPCDDPQDSFWTDLFGEYAFEAYLFYCGVEA